MLMLKKTTLRDIQQRGKRAIKTTSIVFDRTGPVGMFVPANIDTLPRLQAAVRRYEALESLRAGWLASEKTGVNQLTDRDIDLEIKRARRDRKKRRT